MDTKTISATLPLLMLISAFSLPVASQQDARIASLERGVNLARTRVEMSRKQVAAADSLINLGFLMIKEGKEEVKGIYEESKVVEKKYDPQRKSIEKLTSSKDKQAALKAKSDLRALETAYRTENLALEKRLREAERKQSSGASYIQRGKTAKLNARDGLKTAEASLKAAQEKYDAAAGGTAEKKKK